MTSKQSEEPPLSRPELATDLTERHLSLSSMVQDRVHFDALRGVDRAGTIDPTTIANGQVDGQSLLGNLDLHLLHQASLLNATNAALLMQQQAGLSIWSPICPPHAALQILHMQHGHVGSMPPFSGLSIPGIALGQPLIGSMMPISAPKSVTLQDGAKSGTTLLAHSQPKPPPAPAAPPTVKVQAKKRRRYRHEPFPSKLFRMMKEVEENEQGDIISFTPNGRAISIHQPEAFENEIIPIYFRHKNLSSFKRQLSMYGFRRITKGPWEGAFEHPLFQKDKPELCQKMKRVSEFELVLQR